MIFSQILITSHVEFSFDSGFSVIFRRLKAIPEVELGEGSEKSSKKSGVKSWEKRLGEKQLGIIREIINDPQEFSIVEISQRIGLGTTAIENNIAKFKEKGILKRVGPAKGGHWEIIDESMN